jgi:hypothetical protein
MTQYSPTPMPISDESICIPHPDILFPGYERRKIQTVWGGKRKHREKDNALKVVHPGTKVPEKGSGALLTFEYALIDWQWFFPVEFDDQHQANSLSCRGIISIPTTPGYNAMGEAVDIF